MFIFKSLPLLLYVLQVIRDQSTLQLNKRICIQKVEGHW